MSLFVDTSVWSLAFRRYAPVPANERRELVRAIEAGEEIVTTGLVLQELLLLRAEEPDANPRSVRRVAVAGSRPA